jgi:hypothetical protein
MAALAAARPSAQITHAASGATVEMMSAVPTKSPRKKFSVDEFINGFSYEE